MLDFWVPNLEISRFLDFEPRNIKIFGFDIPFSHSILSSFNFREDGIIVIFFLCNHSITF